MKLIDLDQTIVVPVEDDEMGVTCEMQMTVAEMFDRFLDGFEPEIIDAVPVEWLENMLQDWLKSSASFETCGAISAMLHRWREEQEAG